MDEEHVRNILYFENSVCRHLGFVDKLVEVPPNLLQVLGLQIAEVDVLERLVEAAKVHV